jgi:hypothetical protein
MNKYQSQQTKLDVRLSVPLMQFFFVSNRTDKALDLFMSQVCFIICIFYEKQILPNEIIFHKAKQILSQRFGCHSFDEQAIRRTTIW